MPVKKVYVNDVLIGQASTWAEVYRLLGVQGVHFMGKPGAAEGPSAFYLSGAVARRVEDSVRSVDVPVTISPLSRMRAAPANTAASGTSPQIASPSRNAQTRDEKLIGATTLAGAKRIASVDMNCPPIPKRDQRPRDHARPEEGEAERHHNDPAHEQYLRRGEPRGEPFDSRVLEREQEIARNRKADASNDRGLGSGFQARGHRP